MEMAARLIAFALGLASLFVACSAADFVAFSYGKGPNGPDQWGSLKPEWKACNGGAAQSPIDIDTDNDKYTPSLQPLTRDYVDANATLVNNGFNIELRYEEGVGNVFVDGINFSLQQVHWHTPSEHTIRGERFPAEMHMVHKTKDNKIAVVAILYQLGHTDTFINQLMDNLKVLVKEKCSDKEEAQIPVGVVQNKALKRTTRKYYRYEGSLTAPPCTENVIWTIMGKVREISEDQLAALKAPLAEEYRNNSRPTQPINGRIVKLYDEGKHKNDDDDDDDDQKDKTKPQ